jgi:hypothetical protein
MGSPSNMPSAILRTDETMTAEDFLHPDAAFWDSIFAQVSNPLHFK